MKILIFLTVLIVSFALLGGCPNPQGPQAPLPDLTVAITPPAPAAMLKSAAWPFSVRVTNLGTSDAPASSLEYRIANDAVPAGPDIVITVTIPIIAAGAFIDTSLSGLISDHGLASGTNHVTVTAASSNTNKSVTAVLPVIYDEIIIDTYYPTGPGFGINSMDLFGPLGTLGPTLKSDNGNNPDTQHNSFAYIDYTSGLAPGNYYVRFQAALTPTDSGPYAVRVLTIADTSPRNSSWYFLTAYNGTTNPEPYEDDSPLTSGIPGGPTPTIHIGEKLNRYLAANDVDWVKLTLK